jgi:hypothetical protein
VGDHVVAGRPHPTLEAFVEVLLPTSRRDEALGDLYERYTSPYRYVFEACQVIPAILISQSVRTLRRPQHRVSRATRSASSATVVALTGRLTAALASSGSIRSRSIIGLVGTAAWFAVASVHARIAKDARDQRSCVNESD